ncbi:hypothetical protein XENTR_v10003645 [Xenopus tropicalis]|uniref:F-box protein 47 n=1 Tax=Xenopus tropicalis TaxID=8364 RepID=A0A6I8RYN3_XENTR|nr:hypothetical protein XENTR_v10003645 [Xenopus tropicalis]KAE8574962.1 hypothetical protein XENTR_v10003645 [Xenopus tropicalis]KAE8574963.1 hypothetical protein XENTR_v10003645 [Xenopus tropicalis]
MQCKEIKNMAVPSSSFTLIHKKFRCRRMAKQVCEDKDLPDINTLGSFQSVPLEIFHMILGCMPVRDISIFSMTSRTISSHITTYIYSPSGILRLLVQDFHNSGLEDGRQNISILEHYKYLGLLLKRCTLLLSTKKRLNYTHKLLSQVPCFKLGGCASPMKCVGLSCYGLFLQVLTAGWDEMECHRVYNTICNVTNLPRKVQSLVSGTPGSSCKQELYVRLFCRNVLLDHWVRCKDTVFWLTRLLKPWPLVHQARLLYILFGPVSTTDGYILWKNMTQSVVDEKSLEGLATTIKLLYETDVKGWTADDVISLVEELTVVPNEWLLENNARFLILTGNSICFSMLARKAVKGRRMDLARVMVFLALVCQKDLYCMEWAVNMMRRVSKFFCTNEERKCFLGHVEMSFACTVTDMLQSVLVAEERDEEDVNFRNLFHLLKAQANFHKEILYLTLTPSV